MIIGQELVLMNLYENAECFEGRKVKVLEVQPKTIRVEMELQPEDQFLVMGGRK